MRLGSLCTGYGGLDMAAHALFPDAELVFVSDNDKHVTRFLDQRFPDVRNLGDFTQLDRLPDCDILTAGFPCQPVSHAGKRKGTDDDRWLWDDIERVLGGMERPPGLLLLENVRGLLTANGGNAMGRVVEGLASLGYVGRYRVLAASDVGAPHRRERVFIVACHSDLVAGEAGFPFSWRSGPVAEQGAVEGTVGSDSGAGGGSGVAANAEVEGCEGPVDVGAGCEPGAGAVEQSAGCCRAEAAGQFGPYAAAVARWEAVLGRPAPDPTVASNPVGAGTRVQASDASHEGWGDPDARQSEMVRRRDGQADAEGAVPGDRPVGRRLNPRFVEWMMGLPDGWVTGLDLSRTAQLKMLGNGVVPQQAYAAYRGLL